MANTETVDLIKKKAALMRRHVIEMGFGAGGRGAHFGPALSSIEVVASLFFGVMNHDPQNPTLADRDRFVQSKGHACLALYSALGEAGYITKEQMATFKCDGSFLAGHPTRNLKYGIEVSSGTLGNGFAVACGMAKAAKIKGEDHNVFCLVGDGECNEGVIWEAAMNAVKYELDNLVAIIDRNFVQRAGTTKDIMDVDVEALWRAAGWDVLVLEDGNDAASLLDALEGMKESRRGPRHALIANTTLGQGCPYMVASLNWHPRSQR